MKILWMLGAVGLILPAAIVLIVWWRSVANVQINTNADGAADYNDAVARIESYRDTGEEIHEKCRTIFMGHGERTEHSIVLFHGYTRCPLQFQHLGNMLYEHGYNVLIPRAPLNGLKDRLNNRQEYLTAEELAECADEALDIAAGLGEKVTVLGFSMGGVQATWAAVNRHDIDTAVIISPALGVNVVPAVLTPAVLRLTRILPNRYLWWDKQRKASFGTADMYPRFSTHALAEMLRLAEKPRQGIPRPKAHRAIIVTNACDRAINNTMIYAMTERWRQKGKTTKIITYEFESSLDLTHEIIAPLDPDERIDFVHEKLFELITANGG